MSNIEKVLNRAMTLLSSDRVDFGVEIPQSVVLMDLMNANVDYDRLADFPDYDFAHDIIGIISNMNRNAMPPRLENCFTPRSSK
jgi:hypothetical protein